jgi:hypothetical protein
MDTPKRTKRCAYCENEASTVDHVIPKSLYPSSLASSKVQRITVESCESCNNGWSNDEAHFRNVLLLAGDPNSAVRELWEGKAQRSFTYADGSKRARDLVGQLVPVETPEGERHLIYPGRDDRVLRIVRKIVRGLCHHHGLLSPIQDSQVLADIQRFEVQPEFLAEMEHCHAEKDVLEYRFGVVDERGIHSGWLLTFFGRTPFFCIVLRSTEAGPEIQVA